MPKISTIILAYNAEEIIADCLDSVSFSDEVIIVDGGSSDKTEDIAKRFGARIIDCKSIDFSEKRNEGLKKAKGEWVLYVDTDERVTPQLEEDIKNAVNNKDFAAYKINRRNFYLGNNEWPRIEQLERLFRRDKLKKWHGKLHENPIVDGKIGELKGYLLHYTHTDLSSMLNKTISWSEIEADNRFKANHPKMAWWRFPRVMLTAFYDSYIRQSGYKIGSAGLIESMYQAFSIFVTYARLWEKQKSN